MNESNGEQLIDQLQTTQKQLGTLLESVANHQDWQPAPEQWSFRYIAAHLATVEEECFLERIKQFAASESPHFDYYDNSGWDFSRFELIDSLRHWATARKEVFNLVRTMPESIWSRRGMHATLGTLTLLDLLQVMLEHDQEHLQELKQMMQYYQNEISGKTTNR